MKQTRNSPRRLSVSDAKARLSEALRDLKEGPAIIHNRGRDVAILMSMQNYEQFAGESHAGAGSAFLAAVQELKQRMGGGTNFQPQRAGIKAKSPIAERSRS